MPLPAAPASATRQRMSSVQRRAAIVDSALKVFAESGFRGTTTRQLAAAAGVSEPVLYMHFHTKRDLYSAILAKLLEGGPPEKLCQLATARDDRTFFLQLAHLIVEWHEADPSRSRILMYSALEGHELSDLFHRNHIVPFFSAFSGYIRQRIKDGAFRRVDPQLAARSFVGMIVHYAQDLVIFHMSEEQNPRKKTLEAMVDIFLNGVKR